MELARLLPFAEGTATPGSKLYVHTKEGGENAIYCVCNRLVPIFCLLSALASGGELSADGQQGAEIDVVLRFPTCSIIKGFSVAMHRKQFIVKRSANVRRAT